MGSGARGREGYDLAQSVGRFHRWSREREALGTRRRQRRRGVGLAKGLVLRSPGRDEGRGAKASCRGELAGDGDGRKAVQLSRRGCPSVFSLGFGVANIKRPLVAVRRIIEKGNDVVFDQESEGIVNKARGRRSRWHEEEECTSSTLTHSRTERVSHGRRRRPGGRDWRRGKAPWGGGRRGGELVRGGTGACEGAGAGRAIL